MKLRNKKTGEIVDARMSYREDTAPIVVSETTCDENGQSQGWPYNSLAELNEEWEDYEEPKEYWTVDCGVAIKYTLNGTIYDRTAEAVGLKFDTEEECKRAIEKLKAWKRLRDIGCSFDGWNVKTASSEGDHLLINLYVKDCTGYEELLDLLFGGEDD